MVYNIENINSSMDSFYSCTNVPIKSYTKDFKEICSLGDLNKFSIDHKTIVDKIGLSSKGMISFSIEDDIFYTLCGISKGSFDMGFYIVGPYIIERNVDSEIIYKPIHCIPHLLELLYINTKEEPKAEEYNFNITKAIKYLKENYTEQITLDSLTNYLGINKTYFCNLFKKVEGKTFIQYLNEYRIERSKELLSNKNDSITEIALSVGFTSQNYFNTVFKKIEGITPLEFRNKALSNKIGHI